MYAKYLNMCTHTDHSRMYVTFRSADVYEECLTLTELKGCPLFTNSNIKLKKNGKR